MTLGHCCAAFTMSYIEQTSAENVISRPHLIWVIQNFQLRLMEVNGEVLAGPEWIEEILRQVDHSNNGTSAFRKQFTEFFASMDVKTLPYPVESLDKLEVLSSLPSSALHPKYLQAVRELAEELKRLAEPKKIGKLRLTGSALAEMVERWTESMNVPIANYRSNSAEELLGHIMLGFELVNCFVHDI